MAVYSDAAAVGPFSRLYRAEGARFTAMYAPAEVNHLDRSAMVDWHTVVGGGLFCGQWKDRVLY